MADSCGRHREFESSRCVSVLNSYKSTNFRHSDGLVDGLRSALSINRIAKQSNLIKNYLISAKQILRNAGAQNYELLP